MKNNDLTDYKIKWSFLSWILYKLFIEIINRFVNSLLQLLQNAFQTDFSLIWSIISVWPCFFSTILQQRVLRWAQGTQAHHFLWLLAYKLIQKIYYFAESVRISLFWMLFLNIKQFFVNASVFLKESLAVMCPDQSILLRYNKKSWNLIKSWWLKILQHIVFSKMIACTLI